MGSIKLGANDGGSKEDMTHIDVTDPVTLQFAIRYLNLFNKAAPLSTHTSLYLH